MFCFKNIHDRQNIPTSEKRGIAGMAIRVGGCYESLVVAAKILIYTLVKPKSVKKVFKSTGNRLGIGLETLLLWFPLC